MATPIVRRIPELAAFRLRAGATNKMVPLLPAGMAGGSTSVMLEIWDVGGRQPENVHADSPEIFYFIHGSGLAHCDGHTVEVGPGDLVVLPAGSDHYIENVGEERLYALTTLLTDDGSHANPEDPGGPLEEQDLAILLDPQRTGARER
jgi:mannose-6-phosphate isomerase-like protein (cupin superfamily)